MTKLRLWEVICGRLGHWNGSCSVWFWFQWTMEMIQFNFMFLSLQLMLIIGLAQCLVVFRVVAAPMLSDRNWGFISDHANTVSVILGAVLHYVTIQVMTRVRILYTYEVADYVLYVYSMFSHYWSPIWWIDVSVIHPCVKFYLGRTLNPRLGVAIFYNPRLWTIQELSTCMFS